MIVKENKKMTRSGKEEYHVTQSTSKRIGFFAAILVVIGSCVGTGIFFKSGTVMQQTNYSILLSLGCWLIAGFAVVAMGIALIDIATQGKQDSLGLVSWAHTFNNLFLYKVNKNFYSFIFIPIKFFVIPVYICQSFQSGLSYIGATIVNGQLQLGEFGHQVMNMPWWSILLIVMVINSFFIIAAGLSVNVGNKINMGIMYVKFVPIAFAFIIGFVVLGIHHGDLNPVEFQDPTASVQVTTQWLYDPNNNGVNSLEGPKPFVLFSPIIGVFMSMSAIFYAYDGFYVAAGIQGELKEPKKISLVILFGLLTVTVMYLAISLSITLGAYKGNWINIGLFFVQKNCAWVYVVISLLISIGILTEVNVYSMWFALFFKTLIDNREVPFANKLQRLNNMRRPYAGVIYLFVIVTSIVTVLTVIGALGYQDHAGATSSFKDWVNEPNGLETAYLYMFSDLISNWQTVFTFVFLSLTILGWLNQRVHDKNHKKSRMDKVKMACAVISSVLTFTAMAFQIMDPFANLIINVDWNNAHGLTAASEVIENQPQYQSITSQICLIAILGGLILIIFVPAAIEARVKREKEIFKLDNKIHGLKLELQRLLEAKNEMDNVKIEDQNQLPEFTGEAKEIGDVPVNAELGLIPASTDIK